jgi:peptide/nickel transport system substrate-binding protein
MDKRDLQDSAGAVGRRTLLQGFAGAATLAAAPPFALAQTAPREAPELAQMVAAGRLPPLAQRLPASPMIVTPHETAGRYGGTLRRGLRGSSDHNGILRMVGNQGLVRWNLEFTQVQPNVAERWDVNPAATEFVFHLRAGMKWSDGRPFTADDVVFAIEDCAKNSELYRSVPSVLTIGGKPCVVTKVSDTAVRGVVEASSCPNTIRVSTRWCGRPTCPIGLRCSAPAAATSRSPRVGATRRSRRSIPG